MEAKKENNAPLFVSHMFELLMLEHETPRARSSFESGLGQASTLFDPACHINPAVNATNNATA
jgi:hypothetical protein